jgi:signal transduction histidine kinase
MTTRRPFSTFAIGCLLILFTAGLAWLILGFSGNFAGREILPQPDVSVEVLAEPRAGLGIEELRRLPATNWVPWSGARFAPAAADQSVWVRFVLRNPGPDTRQGVLENADSHADRAELYLPNEAEPRLSGERVPSRDRAIAGSRVAFPLSIPPGSELTAHLRFEDHYAVWLSPAWWPRLEAFHAAVSHNLLALGGYYGLLCGLIFYNAILWLRLRFPETGKYLLSLTAFTAFAFLAIGGVHDIGFPLGSPWMETWATVALAISGAALAEYARTLLDLPTLAPRADRIIRLIRNIMAAFAPGALLATAFGFSGILSYVVLASGINHFAMLLAAISAWRAGARQARYFVLASAVLFLGFAPVVAVWIIALPMDITSRAMMVGSALQMLFLSVATADRFALIQRDKLRSQEALLEETAQREAIQEAYADELQTEVRERTSELLSANADKDRMITVLGHDLRGPLTALTQTAELLTRKADPAGLDQFASDTVRTGSQMLLLIEDLVLWAQLRAGTRNPSVFSIPAMISQVLTLHSVLAEREGVQLTVEMPDEASALSDLVLTQTLVRNLVSNAVRFASTRVVLRVTKETEAIRLSVADDGPGMPADIASRLTSGDSAQWPRASGLGLRLCLEIAHVLETRFEVKTSEAGGTEISFILPEASAL